MQTPPLNEPRRIHAPASALALALVVVAAAAAASCAAPSRRLTSRQVEDPIVLPRRMASVGISPYVNIYTSTGETQTGSGFTFGMGLTDRLEWRDVLSLRYAFLDDSPGSPRPGAPFSLALQAGARGVGYGSINGWVVFPLVELTASKHLADRWLLWARLSWDAQWWQRSGESFSPDGSTLVTHDRWSVIGGSIGAQRQLVDRIALSAWVSARQSQYCLSSFCDWETRNGSTGLSFSYRPWHWLTWSLSPSVGGTYRPRIIDEPQSPELPVDMPPRRTGRVGVTTSFYFYW